MSVPDSTLESPNYVEQDITRFVMVPGWLLDTGVSANAVKLYVTLGTYANGQGGTCFPLRQTLADRMGSSLSTVKRAIGELTACGALTVTGRISDAGDQTSNLYTLAFTAPFTSPDISPGQDGVGSRVTRPRFTGEPTGRVTREPRIKPTRNQTHSTRPPSLPEKSSPRGATPAPGKEGKASSPGRVPTIGEDVIGWIGREDPRLRVAGPAFARFAALAGCLIGGGWTPEQIVFHAVHALPDDIRHPVGLLSSRLATMPPTPPPGDRWDDRSPAAAEGRWPEWCGECDEVRMLEQHDGRMRHCPTCSPAVVGLVAP